MNEKAPHNFWCDVCGGVVYGLSSDHEHPLRTAFSQLTAAQQDFCRRLYETRNSAQAGLFVTGASKDAMVTGGWIEQIPDRLVARYRLTPAALRFFEHERTEPHISPASMSVTIRATDPQPGPVEIAVNVPLNQPGEHAIEGTDLFLMLRETGSVSVYRKQGAVHIILVDSLDAVAARNRAKEKELLERKLTLAEQGLGYILHDYVGDLTPGGVAADTLAKMKEVK